MNNIKERPIVLTAQEVGAVLAGGKTQHRVPVDTDHSISLTYHSLEAGGASPERLAALPFDCPFGNVGDRLWVQEEHRPIGWLMDDGEVMIEYRDSYTTSYNYLTDEELENNPNDDYPLAVIQELLDRNVPIDKGTDRFDFSNPDNLPHWRNAEDMPRWASRILLEITDIRIERVQDISEADALAMGVKSMSGHAWGCALDKQRANPTGFKSPARFIFRMLWREWHGVGAWDRNEWVRVIEFKTIEGVQTDG